MNSPRRHFLQRATLFTAAAAAFGSGLLKSAGAWAAATWNVQAFTAKTASDAYSRSGYTNAVTSSDIILKLPEIAEDGSVVPVQASSNIPGTTSMAIFVPDNPNPLIADFTFLNGAEPFIATRIKMAKTSSVQIMAKADGKVYMTSKSIKVTAGGCGG